MTNIDLGEATKRVNLLQEFNFEDSQPDIEGHSFAILLDTKSDYNFSDRGAYESRWSEETDKISEVRNLILDGDKFLNMLYSYRSVSKALPQVKNADQGNKNEIYEGSYEVLDPEIKKLKDFMDYKNQASKVFCSLLKEISLIMSDKKKKDDIFPSETYLSSFVQLLDRFAKLDFLKNIKACLNNDFAFFKRALGFLKKEKMSSDDKTEELHTLYLFLAHQNSITTNLKTDIQKVAGYDDVLIAVGELCEKNLTSGLYITPNEKNSLLRVLAFVIYLLDSDGKDQNVFKSKKVAIGKLSAPIKKSPFVPLVGDMPLNLYEQLIKKIKNFDPKVWGPDTSVDSKMGDAYLLTNGGTLEAIRKEYQDFSARLSILINDIRLANSAKKPIGKDLTEKTKETLREGLRLLCDWSHKVVQQSAWKYSHPNGDTNIRTNIDYERAVRYNYTSEEKFALIETIAMIKGLGAEIIKHDSLLSPLIYQQIHDEIQQFILVDLPDSIRLGYKKKRTDIINETKQLRALVGDWTGGSEPSEPAYSGKKPSSKDAPPKIKSRPVAPSGTQIELMRNLVYGLKRKKDLSKYLPALEKFYNNSFFYPSLLNLVTTVVELTDLGDLWYREFYLELSKELQFPIDMSLPWVLTDHILESKDPSMLEYMFYPLDLYNDAGYRALNGFKQRFLYDEVEAEVNLCFDQLVYKLSEQVYAHYKTTASAVLLDKAYKEKLEPLLQQGRLRPPRSRYDSLLKQRHVQLLGRSIDLNFLMCQRMNGYIRQNIDFALGRFDASDITGILDLDVLLSVIKFTHLLLSEHFELDSWDSIFNEVNDSISLVSFHGRINLHVIFEIISDFAPHWTYNGLTERFIRSPLIIAEETQRDNIPKKPNNYFLFGTPQLNSAYSYASELSRKFFGAPHIEAIFRLVGRENIPLLVSECLQNMDLKLRNVLVPYVRELMGGLAVTKLPIHDYGTEGAFGFFQLKLKEIIGYPELRPHVLQSFREIGNWIIFLKQLDRAMSLYDVTTFVQASPFLGLTPKTVATASENADSSPFVRILSTLSKSLSEKPDLTAAPSILADLPNNAWKADKAYRPTSQNVSLFKAVLSKFDDILAPVKPEWSGAHPENGIMNIENTTEFYRLWSALQFVACLPGATENELSIQEVFGEGLNWAACTIIYFLNQRYKFDAFDFSYHILNVEDTAALSSPSTQGNLPQFFQKVYMTRDLNNAIFNTLSGYIQPKPKDPLVLHPPKVDNTEATFVGENTGKVIVRGSTSSSLIRNSGSGQIPTPDSPSQTHTPPSQTHTPPSQPHTAQPDYTTFVSEISSPPPPPQEDLAPPPPPPADDDEVPPPPPPADDDDEPPPPPPPTDD